MNNQIISNLKKVLTSLRRKNFSLVNVLPSDVYSFESFKKAFDSNLDNIVIVQSKAKLVVFDKEIKFVSPKVFSEKQDEFFEKTKNAVVIWHDKFEKLEGLQAYYPLIYLKVKNYDDFSDKNKDALEDWKPIYYQDEKLLVLVNRNIKNFRSFSFEDFEIKPMAKPSEVLKKEDQALKDLGLNLRYNEEEKKAKFVTKLRPKKEINYNIFDNLPKPTIYPPDRRNVKWCQEFYNYIHAILKIIIPEGKERIIDTILNKSTMKVWIRSFTHITTNPDGNENYESLESVGDKVLKNAFSIYYFERFPYAGPGELNDANKETQSDEAQGELGDRMGLINWVKLDPILQNNMKIKEDLQEAFAGAVDVILSDVNLYGFSSAIFVNMFKKLYSGYEFDTKIDASTWVTQIIPQIKPSEAHKIRVDSPTVKEKTIEMPRPLAIDYDVYQDIVKEANRIIKENDIEGIIVDEKPKQKKATQGIFIRDSRPNSKYKAEVYIDKYGSEVFKFYGFNFKPGQVIGTAVESTKAPAKRRAGENARIFLNKHGIDKEWIKEQKHKKIMEDFLGLYQPALLKAKQKNKNIVKLGIKSKPLKKDSIYVLYGEDKNGHKEALDFYIPESPGNNYYELARKYLGEN